MDKKYGAYICTGCGIGDALDIEALSGVVTSEMSMDCKTHQALCGSEGRALIEGDIAGGVNTVVICGCSPRVMENEFNFGDDKITVRGNIREQVVWCRAEDADPEYVQELASDYVRMACTRAQKTDLPEPYQLEEMSKKILVMGGGVAGLTAATEAAKAGYEVTLVEKSDKLGGKALEWRKQLPTKAPWTDLEDPSVSAMVSEVEAASNITVKTSSEVARIGGSPGNFGVTFKAADEKSEWDAPAKVAVDEQDLIDKGEMEDPNAGLKP